MHPRDRYNRYGGSNLPDQVHSNTDEIIDSKKDTKPIVVLPTAHSLNLRKKNKSKTKKVISKPTVVLPTSHSVNLQQRNFSKLNSRNALVPKGKFKLSSSFIKRNSIQEISKAKRLVSKIKKEKQLVDKVNKLRQPKIVLQKGLRDELPKFNTKILVSSIDAAKREKEVFDQIIKQLPPDNDIYSISYDAQTDTFTVHK